MVVPMNRDYDEGRMDGECNPLPDCTPGVYTLPNADYDDELVAGTLTLPDCLWTWTMTVPAELRVWHKAPFGGGKGGGKGDITDFRGFFVADQGREG